MAKKKGFSFGSYMDQDQLDTLIKKGGSVAPTEEEINVLKESKGDIEDIPVSSLVDYHNHTYKVLDNEDMELLVESIKEHGIILPLTVRKTAGGKYEIISGHRRTHAARLLGLETVPCLVTEVDDATADIMMVDTNLHREEILPSEKAKSYDLRIRAMKAKGMETDEFSDSQYEEMLASDVKSSKINVYRYRKLVKLIPELLDLVDSKDISVNAGAKLAAVPKNAQHCIVSALAKSETPMTIENAGMIATAARSGLTEEKVLAILEGDFRPRKKKTASVPTAIKEKNIKSSYPSSIKKLSGADKEEFLKDCIKSYIETHDTWNGHDILK